MHWKCKLASTWILWKNKVFQFSVYDFHSGNTSLTKHVFLVWIGYSDWDSVIHRMRLNRALMKTCIVSSHHSFLFNIFSRKRRILDRISTQLTTLHKVLLDDLFKLATTVYTEVSLRCFYIFITSVTKSLVILVIWLALIRELHHSLL